MACFFYIVLTPISTTSGQWSTGNTRKYQQIDVYIYQCVDGYSKTHPIQERRTMQKHMGKQMRRSDCAYLQANQGLYLLANALYK